MPKTVNIHDEARTHLSRLVRQVQAGEEILIARGGKPIVRLVAVESATTRNLGRDRGLLRCRRSAGHHRDPFDRLLIAQALVERYRS